MSLTTIKENFTATIKKLINKVVLGINYISKYGLAVIFGAWIGILRGLISPPGFLGGIIALNLAAVGLMPAGIGLFAAFLMGNVLFAGITLLAGIIKNHLAKKEKIEEKCQLPKIQEISQRESINPEIIKRIIRAEAEIDDSPDTTLSSGMKWGMSATNLILNIHSMPRLYNLEPHQGGKAEQVVAGTRGDF